jgi:arylsulfatase A-like enzyme
MDAAHRLASKAHPYENSVRVPLVMRRPGSVMSGRVDQQHLVSTGLDLLPTLCDYAGAPVPDHCLGRSLRPIAEGKGDDDRREFVVMENDWFRALRGERYKYCAFEDGESLVDLETDPGEMIDLVHDPAHAQTLAQQRAGLQEWCTRSDDRHWLEVCRSDAVV